MAVLRKRQLATSTVHLELIGNNGKMAHWESQARGKRRFARMMALIMLVAVAAPIAHALAPALVYQTQVYGRGNADSRPAGSDLGQGNNAMAVDAAGNVYVAGTTSNGLNTDFLTVKYSAGGAVQWRAIANGAGNGDDIAYAIALDANGNVWVTGSSQSLGQSDYLTVKYDGNGNELWRATMDGAGNGDDVAYAIAVDGAGNAFVTGSSFSGTNDDYVTVKYDAAGVEQWRNTLNGAGNSLDRAVALCLDAAGNALVTGYHLGSGQNFDYIITVCDNAKESCPVFPGQAERIHQSFEDPPAPIIGDYKSRLEIFRNVRDEISEWLKSFVAEAAK